MAADARDPYALIARFYDLSTADYDDDLPFYREFARRGSGVLEFGVGTGRVALSLAATGARVLGIDRSLPMLMRAARASAARHADVGLLAGEMGAPPIRGRFSLLICALNSFLHLSRSGEQIAALRAWRELLAPGGRLLLDLPGPGGDWGDWNPGERPLVPAWTRPLGDESVTRLTTFVADPAAQVRFYTDIYDVLASDGALRRWTTTYPLRWVFPEQALLLLEAAGLRLLDRYGGYELESFDMASERMLLVAERGGSA
jgi:SAM-dependent methyltransferase